MTNDLIFAWALAAAGWLLALVLGLIACRLGELLSVERDRAGHWAREYRDRCRAADAWRDWGHEQRSLFEEVAAKLVEAQNDRDEWRAEAAKYEAAMKRAQAELPELQRLLGIDGRAQIGGGDGRRQEEEGLRPVQEGGAEELARPAVRPVPDVRNAADQG